MYLKNLTNRWHEKKRKKTDMENREKLDKWSHYPKTPFGDIDICLHGCTREHGDTSKKCIICDYTEEEFKRMEMKECENPDCKGKGWHLDGKCLRCEKW